MSMNNNQSKKQVNKPNNFTKPGKLKTSHAFTLAELLVVVAIIGVLTAISIPIFSSQLEKSRRATDMANARNVLSALKMGYMSGDIEFTSDSSPSRNDHYACVTVAVGISDMQICVSDNIKVFGQTAGGSNHMASYIKSCGLDNLRVKSRTLEDDGGWDFYTVILYSDGTSRIASGTLRDDQATAWSSDDGHFEINAATWRYRTDLSTIEKAMTKS